MRRANLIDKLHEHKGVENDGAVQIDILNVHVEEDVTVENQGIHDSQLEHALTNNSLQHLQTWLLSKSLASSCMYRKA